ncbi:MAG: hypothetical protein II110_02260 [Treponema sp.]|nr:hypothetical protein [Treponema sp.]
MKKTTLKSCLVLSALVLASEFAFSKDAYIIPSFEFTGGGIKIEAEDMLLESGGKVLPQKEKLEEVTAGRLFDMNASAHASLLVSPYAPACTAKATVTLDAGTYEIMVCEKAFNNKFATIKMALEGNNKSGESSFFLQHNFYPSNPPLGYYELTTRCPCTITLEEKQTVSMELYFPTVKNAKGYKPLCLDYIQIVKVNK